MNGPAEETEKRQTLREKFSNAVTATIDQGMGIARNAMVMTGQRPIGPYLGKKAIELLSEKGKHPRKPETAVRDTLINALSNDQAFKNFKKTVDKEAVDKELENFRNNNELDLISLRTKLEKLSSSQESIKDNFPGLDTLWNEKLTTIKTNAKATYEALKSGDLKYLILSDEDGTLKKAKFATDSSEISFSGNKFHINFSRLSHLNQKHADIMADQIVGRFKKESHQFVTLTLPPLSNMGVLGVAGHFSDKGVAAESYAYLIRALAERNMPVHLVGDLTGAVQSNLKANPNAGWPEGLVLNKDGHWQKEKPAASLSVADDTKIQTGDAETAQPRTPVIT